MTSEDTKTTFKLCDNLFDEIVSFRDLMVRVERENNYSVYDNMSTLSFLIERELKRRAEPPQEKPFDKYPVNDPIYQWFCYYQDKCRDLERKLENRDIQSDIGNTVFGV